MREFKVGDKVTCRNGRKGTVVQIKDIGDYPVLVEMDDELGFDWSYSLEGLRATNFINEDDITHLEEETVFKVGDLVEFGTLEGEVIVVKETTAAYPIVVSFNEGRVERFSRKGLFDVDGIPFRLKLLPPAVPKFHWYALSFIGNREGKADYYYATAGFENNYVTQTSINEIAFANYEDNSWVILSFSYLGHMTKEEFNS